MLPLENSIIYISSISKELPIVIETGVSCAQYFMLLQIYYVYSTQDHTHLVLLQYIDEPEAPDTKSMVGLITEVVLEQGMVNWDNIEDVNGLRSHLVTSA